MMPKQSYLQLLQQSPDDQNKASQSSHAQLKELSLKGSIIKTDESLQRAKNERTAMLSSKDLDFELLSKKDDEIAGYKRGLERLKEYQDELFPTND